MAEEMTVPRAAYSVEEVAASLGVSRRLVYELLAAKRIGSFKLGSRRLISAAELQRITNEGMEMRG